jgi:hypothetical protein
MATKRKSRPSDPRVILAAQEPEREMILLPANERGLPQAEVVRFDKAKAELLNPRLPLSDRQREARAAIMQSVESQPKRAADKAWLDEAIRETLELHQARGVEVEVSTVVRVAGHDGLHTLYKAKRISEEQYQRGVLFRRAWNSRSAGLASIPPGDGAGGGHQHESFVAAAARRAFDLQWLHKVTVHVALKGRPNALAMLNRVAGDGIPMSAYGEGRAFYRNLDDLRLALDLAEQVKAPNPEERR